MIEKRWFGRTGHMSTVAIQGRDDLVAEQHLFRNSSR